MRDLGDGRAQLLLDYVTPPYRDLSPGEFVFGPDGPFRSRGFREILTPPGWWTRTASDSASRSRATPRPVGRTRAARGASPAAYGTTLFLRMPLSSLRSRVAVRSGGLRRACGTGS